MTKINETWKEIKGFEGLYLISESGKVWSNWKNRELKHSVRKYNYCAVLLTNHDKIGKWFYVHRLVALHFVENQTGKPFVNHKDRNPLNNHYSNLEWVTHKENIQHSYKNGRKAPLGQKNKSSKLTNQQVKRIKLRLKKGQTCQQIAKDYPVTYQCIYNIEKKITWAHITVD